MLKSLAILLVIYTWLLFGLGMATMIYHHDKKSGENMNFIAALMVFVLWPYFLAGMICGSLIESFDLTHPKTPSHLLPAPDNPPDTP